LRYAVPNMFSNTGRLWTIRRAALCAAAFALLASNAIAQDKQTTGSVSIYNTAKQKLAAGRSVVGVTISSPDPNMYCALANAGYAHREREAIGERTRDALNHKRSNGELTNLLPDDRELVEQLIRCQIHGSQCIVERPSGGTYAGCPSNAGRHSVK
jgi:hypothetical protein